MKNTSIESIVAKMNKQGKTVAIEDDIAVLKYNGVPLSFEFGEDKMIYVLNEKGKNIFAGNSIDINLLRKYGVPMKQFFNDFYNQGFSLEDSLGNNYLYLTTCPISNVAELNAMFNENEDSYEFFYTETNIVFVISKSLPLFEIRAYDIDDPEKNLFGICLSDEELESNGVNLEIFKQEFNGFELCSGNGELRRFI